MTHPAEQTISDYVDGELASAERVAVQRHLDLCAPCAGLAADLRGMARAAAALDVAAPPAGTWSKIEQQIRRDQRGRRGFRSFVGLAAAAVLIIAALAGLRLWRTPPVDGDQMATAEMPVEILELEKHYDEAFRGLEQIARNDRAVLATFDTGTGAAIEASLAVIDQAIVESRVAVAEEPMNVPAQQSLIESFKMKLALLQDTVALINELRRTETVETTPGVSGS